MKNRYQFLRLIIVWTLSWIIPQFCLPAAAPALPNIGVDAYTLPEGVTFIRNRFFFAEYQKRYDETAHRYIDLKRGEYFKSWWTLTEIAYGVTDRLTLVANNWYYKAKINTIDDTTEKSGVGDFYVFAKYRFPGQNRPENHSICGLLAARFPTGSYKKHPVLRFGDGSTDIGTGFSVTLRQDRFRHSLFTGIWFNCFNDHATDKRHEIEYRLTSEYWVIQEKLNIQLELKGIWFEGNDERLLEIAPGIQYIPVFPLIFQASIKIPVEAKGYYRYPFQVLCGISFALPPLGK